MYIDSNVFYGILKECKYPINSTSVIKFRDEYSEKCNEIFNPNKLLTKNQIDQGFKFTGTMKTDGVAINFHFRRPKLIYSTKEIYRNDPNIRVIGQDPGRTTLFCGVEELRDGTFKKYSLSRGQFYTDTGIKKATQKSNKWNVKYLGVILDELSQTNSRSNSYNDFLCYVSVIKKYYIKLWEEGSKKRHSRQRFKIYSSKKSVYDKFFQSFKNKNDQREIVIAYGDSGFASTAKYELSAPTTELEKQCKKWYKIVKVDEFRTTKLHYGTGILLGKVYEKQDESIKMVRGLLWYTNKTTKESKFINRDTNASKNILKCYRMYPERPSGMSRKDIIQEIESRKVINKTSEAIKSECLM
jgi:hypothetical protein